MYDGTIHATVTTKSDQPERKISGRNKATIITAPPGFASGTHAPTALYELIEDIYERREPYNILYHIRSYHGPNKMKDLFNLFDLADPKGDKDLREEVFKESWLQSLTGMRRTKRFGLVKPTTLLCLHSLEMWSIGAPVYPGIEVDWIAQQQKIYQSAKKNEPWNRFRVDNAIAPGDSTKGLCLPWQSDFNMCHANWWPSVRPGQVVTGTEFDSAKANTQPDQLDKLADIEGPTDSEQCNSNMVRKWNKLGLVARQYYGKPNGEQADGNQNVLYRDIPMGSRATSGLM
ncbi:unnamed protein product [Rhizoctonia solani]|uniref:L-lysine epsilon oxidase C-terminal domain-containing protein n=1 Tax=Rhizoctonia solani TaxID=456999 RepID=A0A8H3E033_9AGAM|nr:unnamed protein product [Rhizoctonia solani]